MDVLVNSISYRIYYEYFCPKKGQHDQRTREILLRDEENHLLGPPYLLIIRLEKA